jgi:hypothetical protein
MIRQQQSGSSDMPRDKLLQPVALHQVQHDSFHKSAWRCLRCGNTSNTTVAMGIVVSYPHLALLGVAHGISLNSFAQCDCTTMRSLLACPNSLQTADRPLLRSLHSAVASSSCYRVMSKKQEMVACIAL